MSALYFQRMLATSTSRLRKPELTAAFAFWHGDYADAVNKRQIARKAKSGRAEVEAELESYRLQATKEISALKKEKDALLKKLNALDGGHAAAEHAMQQKLEEERQKRVEHIAQVGMRRIMQQGLAKGWTAWHDQWANKVHQKRLLAASAGRLAKPKLAHAVSHWVVIGKRLCARLRRPKSRIV